MLHIRTEIKARWLHTLALLFTAMSAANVATAQLPEPHQKEGRIGYVLTERH